METGDTRSKRSNLASFRSNEYGFEFCRKHRLRAFVDIGANIGAVSLRAAAELPEARVLAFEPSNTVFETLVENCKPVGVECFKKAVGKTGSVWFRERVKSVTSKVVENPVETDYQVDSFSLGDLFTAHEIEPESSFVKVDIEGAEWQLMIDTVAVGLLRRCEQVSFEFHNTGVERFSGKPVSNSKFKHWAFKWFAKSHIIGFYGKRIPKLMAIKKQ